MPEARYMVPSDTMVEKKIKPALVQAGAAFKKWYALTDTIYLPSGFPADTVIHARYVRWRIAHATGQSTPSITVVDKKTSWQGDVKEDYILLRREFDALQASLNFMDESYGAWEKQFAFSRIGMEYALDGLRIFVEDILVPCVRWSVEIEGPNDTAITAYAHMLGLGEPVRASVPALVQKRITK